jgi:glycosyltransferase involved in cell wall biosynthesis
LRLVYPLLWSRLGREACREQSVNTAAALARRGFEVTLLMPRRPGDPLLRPDELRAYHDVEGEFRVVQRSTWWASEAVVPSMIWTKRFLEDREVAAADILYSRIPVMLGSGRASPIPFVTDHYRPWPGDWPWLRPLFRDTARSRLCLGFVLHSDYAAQSYRDAGIAPEQVLVAYNGSDPRRMLPRLGKAEARISLGLPGDRPIAVYAGRINARKGLDRILDLAALRPDTLFLLVGSEGESPVERAAAALENVRVLPWQQPAALAPWLYAADVLLIPAASAPLERFRNCILPMKLFQYLAAGRPILAPRAPDTAELLRHGETAWLVPPDAPKAAAEALDRLLQDRPLAAKIEASSRRLADGLSWDHRAERIEAFLKRRFEAVRSLRTAGAEPLSALRI